MDQHSHIDALLQRGAYAEALAVLASCGKLGGSTPSHSLILLVCDRLSSACSQPSLPSIHLGPATVLAAGGLSWARATLPRLASGSSAAPFAALLKLLTRLVPHASPVEQQLCGGEVLEILQSLDMGGGAARPPAWLGEEPEGLLVRRRLCECLLACVGGAEAEFLHAPSPVTSASAAAALGPSLGPSLLLGSIFASAFNSSRFLVYRWAPAPEHRLTAPQLAARPALCSALRAAGRLSRFALVQLGEDERRRAMQECCSEMRPGVPGSESPLFCRWMCCYIFLPLAHRELTQGSTSSLSFCTLPCCLPPLPPLSRGAKPPHPPRHSRMLEMLQSTGAAEAITHAISRHACCVRPCARLARLLTRGDDSAARALAAAGWPEAPRAAAKGARVARLREIAACGGWESCSLGPITLSEWEGSYDEYAGEGDAAGAQDSREVAQCALAALESAAYAADEIEERERKEAAAEAAMAVLLAEEEEGSAKRRARAGKVERRKAPPTAAEAVAGPPAEEAPAALVRGPPPARVRGGRAQPPAAPPDAEPAEDGEGEELQQLMWMVPSKHDPTAPKRRGLKPDVAPPPPPPPPVPAPPPPQPPAAKKPAVVRGGRPPPAAQRASPPPQPDAGSAFGVAFEGPEPTKGKQSAAATQKGAAAANTPSIGGYRYKERLCTLFASTGGCRRAVCTFAHGAEDLAGAGRGGRRWPGEGEAKEPPPLIPTMPPLLNLPPQRQQQPVQAPPLSAPGLPPQGQALPPLMQAPRAPAQAPRAYEGLPPGMQPPPGMPPLQPPQALPRLSAVPLFTGRSIW